MLGNSMVAKLLQDFQHIEQRQCMKSEAKRIAKKKTNSMNANSNAKKLNKIKIILTKNMHRKNIGNKNRKSGSFGI